MVCVEKLKKHGFEFKNLKDNAKKQKIEPKIKKYRLSFDFLMVSNGN